MSCERALRVHGLVKCAKALWPGGASHPLIGATRRHPLLAHMARVSRLVDLLAMQLDACPCRSGLMKYSTIRVIVYVRPLTSYGIHTSRSSAS